MRSDINDVIYVMKKKIPLLFGFWWFSMITKWKGERELIGFQGGWRIMFECGEKKKKTQKN
jgi:hypothetical protein